MFDTSYNLGSGLETNQRRGTKLREVAYHAIKDAILQGTVKPDMPLVEERLATELKISRTPVREALAILEHEGLIEAIPYQGLFVKDITANQFLELYEAVELIEAELAQRAALSIKEQDITALAELLEQAEQCIPHNVPGHLRACRLFQQRMGECAQQSYLTTLLISIEERSDLYLISKWQELPAEKMLAAVTDRRAILEALRSHNADLAAQVARTHAQAVRQRWHDLFGQTDTHSGKQL